MNATLDDQSRLVPDPVVGRQDDLVDTNREDDFDFEIGGDDGFDLTIEANSENVNIVDHVEVPEDHDQSAMYQSQEQELQGSVAEDQDDEGYEHGHEEGDTTQLGPDSLSETAEITQDAQIDNQEDSMVAGQEEADKTIENFSQDEVYYEETVGELEDPDNTLHPEPVQDHNLMNTATSVGQVQEGDDHQERTYEADEDGVETGNNAVQDFPLVAETVQNIEIAEGYDNEDHAQSARIAAQAEIIDTRGDPTGAMLAKIDAAVEAAGEPLDQSNWADDDDQDEDNSNAVPIVTVSYRGQEYSMFAQAAEDDPDTYFLDGVDSIHRPLSQFLSDVREVIASEVEAGLELFVRIDGLGLEFGESTAKDFLEQSTLAQIIEVNDKLSQNDGGSQHAELYIFLSVRSNPHRRFAELAKGAEEGQGLSYFEQYYEESPADVSLIDDEELHGEFQEIVSDDLYPEQPYRQGEPAADGAGTGLVAQQYHNAFRVDNDQTQQDTAAISEILGAEADPVENEIDASNVETHPFDGTVAGSADDAREGDDNSFDLTATNAEAIPGDDTFGDAISVVDQVETEMGEDWDHNDGVEGLDGLGATEVGEATEEQAEVLIENSEERHESTDGEKPFSLSGNDCLAPGSCFCDSCLYLAFEDFEGEADETTSDPSVSSPVSTDVRSFLLSGADWDILKADSPEEDHTAADSQAQGSIINMPNDEDYLDLGDDAEDQIATANDNAVDQISIQQRVTPNSSATATLSGEENGQGDGAAATQDSTDLHQSPEQTTQNEVDEIDWNHDEDEDIGVADQNPTDLSPSSLSAKRSRQEDQDTDGLGEDSGMFSVHSRPRIQAKNLPAAKRRRT